MTRIPLLVFCTAVALGLANAGLRRVCYYTNWAQYRNGPGKFFPENVDPSLCTHLVYAFAKMNGNRLAAYEWNDESTPWMKGMYERFHAIKKQNPSVKLLLAVGGWNMASAPFTRMVATAAGRHEFATSTVTFLRKNNFDGLDMDWEYPANRGSPPQDKQNFISLLQDLRQTFDAEKVPSGKEKLMLSAAVPAGKDNIDTGFDVPAMSKLLDMINLMTYDLHGSWEDHTGHNSPLYARTGETGDDAHLNLDWVTKYWVQLGAPKAKINVGMPLYGRTFKLPYSHTDDSLGAKASGPGAAGHDTREAGFLSYYEICEMLQQGAVKHYDAEQKVPYLVKGDLWAGYDDPASLRQKVDYVKGNGFGGVMVWALDLDDFTGICGQGKYPLMSAIKDELTRNVPFTGTNAPNPTTNAPATTPPPTTHAPITTRVPIRVPVTTRVPVPGPTTHVQVPVTNAPVVPNTGGHLHHLDMVPSSEFDCRRVADGYYASPTSCSEYYICAAAVAFKTDCHPGLLFNINTLYCDFQDHVNCQAHNGATQPPQTPQPTQSPGTNGPVTNPPVTKPPVTQPPAVTSGVVSGPKFCVGKADGYYKDPLDCASFYQCSYENAYHEPCPGGTFFSSTLSSCDWAANVNCS